MVLRHLLRLLRAYQAPKHGLVTLSDKGTPIISRHLLEQGTIAKTVKGRTSPLMVVPPLEGLLPPATIVITEEDLIQILTDLTHRTPGMNPPGVTEMEEAVEEEVAEEAEEMEEGAEEVEITVIRSPSILMPLLGGKPQKNGRSTTN